MPAEKKTKKTRSMQRGKELAQRGFRRRCCGGERCATFYGSLTSSGNARGRRLDRLPSLRLRVYRDLFLALVLQREGLLGFSGTDLAIVCNEPQQRCNQPRSHVRRDGFATGPFRRKFLGAVRLAGAQRGLGRGRPHDALRFQRATCNMPNV